MPTISVTVRSELTPEAALARLVDFSPARAEAWSNVDAEGVTVHETGEGWADVTEGNKLAWERERYTWDAAAGTVHAETTDSNVWGPGSAWTYTLRADGSGTTVDVVAVRNPKGVKGMLIAGLLTVIGKRFIAKGVAGALAA
jgi:hypothetical protein